MQSLLLVSHGSRREESNQEVRLLCRKLADKAPPRFGYVICAFLELAEPSIPRGIQQCIEAGATEIFIVPYFLSAGRHVTKDIPTEVNKKREEYSGVTIKITNYLGSSEENIVHTLLSLVE